MKIFLSIFFYFSIFFFSNSQAQIKEERANFNPPKGWSLVDSKNLSTNIESMCIGKGSFEFPPSMNLSSEVFDGTIEQYLNFVKEFNKAHGSEWKNLGSFQTEAGKANLSQVDTKTEWGAVRMMHLILLKNQNLYILTAAALSQEFSQFYELFFEAFRSFHIEKTGITPLAMGYRVENYGG